MKRIVVFIYGVLCYAIFFATFLYAIGFIGNFGVPKSMDAGAAGPHTTAILIDLLLLVLFAIQHSVMARPAFKRMWTRVIPEPAERSTYVLLSSLCLILLFWQWHPIGGLVWDVEDLTGRTILYGLYGFGWALLLLSTFLLNHFDLFGLRQTWLYLRGREYAPLPFSKPFLYRYVRHPLYVGWFLIFWCTPTMSAGHLLFAIATTIYILVAVQLEERDLVRFHGEAYELYKKEVPMFVPGLKMRTWAGGRKERQRMA